MARPLRPDSRRTARLARAGLIILAVYTVVLNLSVMALTRHTFMTQQRFQEEYLELLATNLVDPPRPYFDFLEFLWDVETGAVDERAVEDYSPSIDWQSVESVLQAATRGSVSSADLLTPEGEIILGASDGDAPPGERLITREEERGHIARAFAGERAALPATPRDPVRRLYIGISGTLSPDPVAVLRLESPVPDPGLLDRMRNSFLVGIIFATAIVVFLWVATIRLLRRAVEAEREISRADRLRALGTLTAGISHEIRNPLGIIALQSEELRALTRSLPEGEERRALDQLAEELHQETRRLRDLLEEFLRFSRAGAEERGALVAISPGEVAAQLVRLWSKGVEGRRRDIRFRDESGAARVLFSEDRLRQILLNLLRNADEALGEGEGEIALSISRRGRDILATVRDNGPGISAEEQGRIFDPFHTTRPEGTGLGLALARAMAENAGGTLTVESRPGRGAAFTLALPVEGEERE